MDSFHFENEMLPIFLQEEHTADHIMHSEMSHWHDHIEIVVIDRGIYTCRTSGSVFSLYKGDICFINRRQLHQLHAESGKESSHMVMIIGTGLLSQNPLLYEKYIRPILEDGQFSHLRFEGSGSPAAQVSRLILRAAELNAERTPGYELDLVGTVFLILRQIWLAYITAPRNHLRDVNAQIQQQMAEYVYAHYAVSISLDDIAAAGNVSRSQCSRLFRQYTSLSPISFLNKHRLELSRELLRSTNESVASVAVNCGFADQSYFNRLFSREYGITPLAYRKGQSTQSGKIREGKSKSSFQPEASPHL